MYVMQSISYRGEIKLFHICLFAPYGGFSPGSFVERILLEDTHSARIRKIKLRASLNIDVDVFVDVFDAWQPSFSKLRNTNGVRSLNRLL